MVIGQPLRLIAKKDARRPRLCLQQVHCTTCIGDRFLHAARAGRRRNEITEIGAGRLDAIESGDIDPGLKRTGGQRLGGRIGPAIARGRDAQLRQAEVQHGARRRADILAKLRLGQDDDRLSGLVHSA